MISVAIRQGNPAQEHKTASTLCRKMLKDILHVANPSTVLTKSDSGRPQINQPGCDISVTHTNGIAAVALLTPRRPVPEWVAWTVNKSGARIGIDIERAQWIKAKRYRAIANRFFSAQEQAEIAKCTNDRETVETFLTFWTRKESAVKATGEGLPSIRNVNTLANDANRQFYTRTLVKDNETYFISLCILKNA